MLQNKLLQYKNIKLTDYHIYADSFKIILGNSWWENFEFTGWKFSFDDIKDSQRGEEWSMSKTIKNIIFDHWELHWLNDEEKKNNGEEKKNNDKENSKNI